MFGRMSQRKPFEESRVLVTGGAGFIGSGLVWALNRRGCEDIIICDQLECSEKWRNLVPLKFRDYIEVEDLLEALEEGALGSFDYVLHMGACSATTERDAAYLIRNNYEFTKDLAHWSLGEGARFVYASSAATYGDGACGMDDTMENLGALRPLNMYGYSKHLFDLYAHRHGLLREIVGLKFFNVFGPNENHKGDMRSVVHKAFAQVREAGVIQLFRSHRSDYKDGCQQRDFLYVKDAVEMALHLAWVPDAWGLYNLGSGRAHTWLELAHAVFQACGAEPRIEFIDMPLHLREKYQYHTQANTSRLRATGYTAPPTPLAEAVADTIRNYLSKDLRLGDEL